MDDILYGLCPYCRSYRELCPEKVSFVDSEGECYYDICANCNTRLEQNPLIKPETKLWTCMQWKWKRPSLSFLSLPTVLITCILDYYRTEISYCCYRLGDKACKKQIRMLDQVEEMKFRLVDPEEIDENVEIRSYLMNKKWMFPKQFWMIEYKKKVIKKDMFVDVWLSSPGLESRSEAIYKYKQQITKLKRNLQRKKRKLQTLVKEEDIYCEVQTLNITVRKKDR